MRKTRNHRAAELIDRLNRGPHLGLTAGLDCNLTRTECALLEVELQRRVVNWLDAYIKPAALALIPELRSK